MSGCWLHGREGRRDFTSWQDSTRAGMSASQLDAVPFHPQTLPCGNGSSSLAVRVLLCIVCLQPAQVEPLPQTLWGCFFFPGCFCSRLIAAVCSNSRTICGCLWRRVKAVSCYGKPDLSPPGSKDEYSLNSGTEEQKGNKRLNCWEKGGMGSGMSPDVPDMQFGVFFCSVT